MRTEKPEPPKPPEGVAKAMREWKIALDQKDWYEAKMDAAKKIADEKGKEVRAFLDAAGLDEIRLDVAGLAKKNELILGKIDDEAVAMESLRALGLDNYIKEVIGKSELNTLAKKFAEEGDPMPAGLSINPVQTMILYRPRKNNVKAQGEEFNEEKEEEGVEGTENE